MIEAYAEKLAITIKKANPEQTTSVDIMKYGIIMFTNGFAVLFSALIIGWLSGKFIETCIALCAYALLRFFSGGFHFKSALHCILYSVLILTLIPHIPFQSSWNIPILIISLIITTVFAPADIKNQTRIPEKYHPWLKYISLLIVIVNFFILSDIVTLAFFAQTIMLIPFRR